MKKTIKNKSNLIFKFGIAKAD
jgi:ABC-type Fe3+-citrate transport system substrate-binding protein